MILLDSLYINNSGGKILLDYLVETLEAKKIPTYYLFDERCVGDYQYVPASRKVFIKATLLRRHHFYLRKKDRFSRVLCFGNLAPTLPLDIPVYTYFHQLLFLDVPEGTSCFNQTKVRLKTLIFNMLKSNTNLWFVQSEQIKKRLAHKYRVDEETVHSLPFYPPLKNDSTIYQRRRDGFAYVSNGWAHKNHENLIAAFCRFYDNTKTGILHLTISEDFPLMVGLIDSKIAEGYPIINHGFIDRNELIGIYQSSTFLIYPSLAESFGLGIVEAIENGCKVLGADLPYIHAVCKPSLVFDPYDIDSITEVFSCAVSAELPQTEQFVFNEIDKIIHLLGKKVK